MGHPPRAVRCPLLIGRDDLLELSDRRLDDVLAGHGQFLLLAGQAGIGKTRLLGAIERKAEARGFVAVGGAVAPQDHDVPAASILDLARSMVRMPAFAALGAALLDLDEAVLAAEHAQRRRLVMETVELILGGLPGPTMLSFEDLQWTDDVSLEIIAELARRSRDRSLLLTGDYRTEDVPRGTSLRQWRARLITQRIAEEVRLAPLDAAQTALVTTLILDTGLPAPRDVAAAVYERTDGIPLHIEELLGALGAEARADGTAIREAGVPETIEDAIIARIATLSPEAQATARAGAVIGRCFVPDVLAGIMDVPPSAIEAPLQELVDQFVLDPPGLRGLYDFRHQLLRDALYRTIPHSERRRYHARAGEFGARLEGASEIHASVHYERAGLHRQAFDAALSGAREASRLSARREAFELYRRAVDNMPDDLDPTERASILEACAEQANSIEEHEIAQSMSRQAALAYRDAGRPARAIVAFTNVLTVWRRDGRPVSERAAMSDDLWTELDAMADDPDVLAARAEVSFTRALIEMDARRLPQARLELARMASYGSELGDPEWRAIADWKSGLADGLDGHVRDGIGRIGDVAHAAVAAGWESTGVTAFREASTIAAGALDYATAVHWIEEGVRYADSIEQSHCAHVMRATLAMVSWAAAEPDDARRRARQAIVDKGCRRGAATARWALGYVSMSRGELDEAGADLTEALDFGLASEEIELVLPPLWGLAEVAVQAGEPDRAFAICRDAFARADAVGERVLLTPFVVTGVRAGLLAGRPLEAAGWLDACARRLEAIPEVTGAALDHGRGLVALADGSTGVARTALESAIDGWDRHGRAWEATGARLDLAHALIRTSRFADAVRIAVEARSAAERLESPLLTDRADTLLRMARGHASDEEPWRPLTSREFEVARLVGEGMTNGEIADALGIAPKTASSHVEHILSKLGASRRAEIATWASQVQARPIPRAGQPLEHATRA
ncbi:MAG TPA: AAA family ATPase [Candidatus Limnocylindrales bacterium]|nr:AAA family ATPase [Candidatus Limnocylindrales bacterium]